MSRIRPAKSFLAAGVTMLLGLLAAPSEADYVGSLVNRVFIDPASVQEIADGWQVGDEVSFILETTPADTGSDFGHAAWMTVYLPDGVQLIGAEYVLPAANGGYDRVPAEDTDDTYDGCSSRGCKFGTVTTGLGNGFVNEVQQDTGIFYSTNPVTRLVVNGFDENGDAIPDLVSPTGVNDQLVYNEFDYWMTRAFGEGGDLDAGNGGQGHTPLIYYDPAGADPLDWYGTGSIVAGPDTYYTHYYHPDTDGTPYDPNNPVFDEDDLKAVGPWRRIAYENAKLGGSNSPIKTPPPSDIEPAAANGTIRNTSVPTCTDPADVTTCSGWQLSGSNPLPSTTTTTGVNAVRFVHGARRLGELENARITLRVTDPQAIVDSFSNDTFCLDSTGGDTSDTAAKDNPFRYYEPQHECNFIAGSSAFVKQVKFVNNEPGNGASLSVGDVLSYEITLTNTTGVGGNPGVTLDNVSFSDIAEDFFGNADANLDLIEPDDPTYSADCAWDDYNGTYGAGMNLPGYTAGSSDTLTASWATLPSLGPGEQVSIFMCARVAGGGVNTQVNNTAHAAYAFTQGGLTENVNVKSTVGGTISTSISGHVYADPDASGDLTPGDAGVGGITVTLYLDDGATPGVYDGTNTVVATTTTLSDGSYAFNGIAPGSYLVVEGDPAGWTSTGDKDTPAGSCGPLGSADACNTIGTITVAAGGASTLNDFFDLPPAADVNTVSGTVFVDNVLQDGLQDPGDPGANGVEVRLYRDSDGSGTFTPGDILLQTQTTDANGNYFFTVVEEGDFVVNVNPATIPLGAGFTTDNVEVATFVGFGNSDVDNDFGFYGGVGSTGGVCFAVADNGDRTVAYNIAAMAFVDIGPTGVSSIEAIAYQTGTDILFGTNAGQLGRINLSTGAFTPVPGAPTSQTCTLPAGAGTVTVNDIDGLAFDPLTGILYGTERDGDGTTPPDVLFQLNPSTGLVVPNTFGGGTASCVRIPTNVPATNNRVDIDDIAINPTDGQMYAITNSGGALDRLIRVNKATGAVTDIGPIGLGGDFEGLGFANDGTLYGTNGPASGGQLFRFNTPPALPSVPPTSVFTFPQYGDYEAVDCMTAGANRISGTTFFDVDSDGVFEPGDGDVGQPNVTVNLYLDNNNDGAVDGGDTLIQTEVTGGAGGYEFLLGADGNFVIETVYPATYPAGSVLTTDNVEEADFVGVNQIDAGNDFGFQAPSDLDVAKTSDATGPVVQGQLIEYTITITNPASAPVTATGITVFDILPPGTSYVAESTLATGFVAGPFELAASDDFETDDYAGGTGVACGTVPCGWAADWVEINDNNDPGGGSTRTENRFDGVALRTDDPSEGAYREVDLSSYVGARISFDYEIEAANSANDGFVFAICPSGAGCAAAPSTTGWTALETVTNSADESVQSRTFDITDFISGASRIRLLGNSGNDRKVWLDNVVIEGQPITAGSKDNDPATAGIPALVNGDPPNLVVAGDGFALRPGDTMTVTLEVVVDNPLDPYRADLLNTVVVSSDQSPVPAVARHNDPVVSGAIGDRVWLDQDGDGVQDIFEEGISNVEVSLRVDDDGTPGPSAGDSVYATRITDANGEYLFDQLPPGDYWVDVTDGTVPGGLAQSPGNLDQPTDPIGSVPIYMVNTAEEFLTADFGYTAPAGTAIIGDYLWNDIDRDGIQDLNEVGIGGVTLDLVSAGPDGVFGTADDVVEDTATTAADGSYLFTGVAAGEYRVEVTDTGGALGGFSVTAGPQSEGNDFSRPVTVIGGDVVDNVDFGYAPDSCLPRIDFETDALGNPLSSGQVIDDEYSAWGVSVAYTVNAPSTGPAMLFDTANPTGGDVDLGAPNETCVPPGLGIGTEGELGEPGENCAPVGNVLIISEDGDGSDPDDSADGGTLTFTFATPTDIDALEFLDAENTQDSVEVRGVTTDNYRDQFDAALYAYNNSDGSLDWTGAPWVETNDEGTPAGGSIFVTGGGELQLEGTGGNPERIIERPIDLTGSTGAVLSYDWRCVGDTESTGAAQDTVHIEVSADGGGSWITLQSKVGDIDMCLEPGDNDSGSDVFNLAVLLDGDPSDSRLRFRFTISATDEDFFVDNVDVRTPLFFGNLTAPGDNAYEVFPVDTADASELIITFPASGALAAIGSCQASIRDKVWLDADGDGLFDVTEMGIEGVTVSLLSDPDGIPNNGDEVVIATTTTDGDGNFSFDGLPDGDYILEITDNDGELSDLGGTTAPALVRELAVSIVDNDDVVGINFGYNAPGTIGDRIWNDANGDGIDDPGELGIGGVTVDLIGPGPDGILGNGDDVVLDTTTTAADGTYLFSGVAPGDFTVEVTDTGSVLAGFTQTGDPDATLDGEGTASIALNGSDLSMDFGYQLPALPDVSGNVFEDFDVDGLDDGAGEPGFEGVTIELRDAGGNVIATTTTDSAGDYSFLDLPAGDYTVAVTDEAGILLGYSLTSGLDALDFTVVAGDITGLDFGYVRMPAYASIGDQVWLDENGDGLPGPNEAGLTGVVVELYDAGPDGLRGTADDVLVATTVTDADGRYLFSDLPAGNYYVDVLESSLPETTPGDLVETSYPAGVDPSAVIALSEGEPYREADFGYVPRSGTAVLGDRIWYDADGDGLQDDGEVGIAGIDVLLFGPGCSPCTVTTGPDGVWLATGLAPGSYSVTFDDADIAALGYSTTPTNNGGDDVYNVAVVAGDAFMHLDFGFDGGTVGSLGDFVWFDTNGDGNVDGGEDGIEDVTINLIADTNGDGIWDPDGADDMFGTADDEPIVGTTSTDLSGDYLFEGLPDGDYLVDVTDIDGALTGLQRTSGTPDANDNSQADPYDATIAAAGIVLTADFGYTAVGEYGSISNFVWRDLNGDGNVDALEPGIEGVSVELWLDVDGNGILEPGVDNLVRREVTDANGEYEFKALPFGDYFVDVTDDFGVLSGFTKTSGVSGLDDNSQDDPYLVMLDSGGPNNVTADFGYDAVAMLSIAGTVFEDQDFDMTFDEGPDEPRVSGATVRLFRDLDGDGELDPGEPQIDTVTTGVSGDYLFSDLPPGDFIVVAEVDGTLVDGYVQTTQAGMGGIQPVTIGPNAVDQDFGFFTPTTTTPVTLSSFEARAGGVFRWTTSTEVGNLGFNLYSLSDHGLKKLNEEFIASSVVDSLEPQVYEFEAKGAVGDAFLLEDVDVNGTLRHHGPFYLEESAGSDATEVSAVAWGAIGEESRNLAQLRNQTIDVLSNKPQTSSPSLAQRSAGFGKGSGGRPCIGCDKNSKYASADLGVDREGIYRVSYEALLGAGIDLAGVPSDRLALTTGGAPVPIFVSPASAFGPGSYVEFVGEPVDTLYTKTNVYRLSVDRRLALRVEQGPFDGAGTPEAFYLETQRFENQSQYNFAARGSDPWYDLRILAYSGAVEKDVAFELDSWLPGQAPVEVEIDLRGGTDFPIAPDHHLVVEINGSQVAESFFDGVEQPELNFSVADSTLESAANTLTLALPHDTGAEFDLVNYDHLTVTYPRAFVARSDALAFESNGSSFSVSGFGSSDFVAYGRREGRSVRLAVQPQGAPGAYEATFGAVSGWGSASDYWVASGAGVLAPSISATRRPEGLTKHKADVVVISHENFLAGLKPWITRRQSEGLRVRVVDVADLYAEYSHGIVDPGAIRKYIGIAHASMKTGYVLLVGGDTYDYFDYLGLGSISFVPSLYAQTDSIVHYAPVDPLYGDVDGDLIPDLAVGRWPVRTVEELEAVIAKTLEYSNVGKGLRAVMASDDRDAPTGYSFTLDSANMAQLLGSDWEIERVSLDELSVPDAREALISGINSGPSLTSYFGHSSLSVWSFDGLFKAADVDDLTNTYEPTIVTQWGCWNTYHVLPTFETLGNRLLLEPDAGAAAVLGASTLTEALSERRLGQRVFERLAIPGLRLGDAITDAKRDLAETEPNRLDVILGWTLLGDPTLIVVPSE